MISPDIISPEFTWVLDETRLWSVPSAVLTLATAAAIEVLIEAVRLSAATSFLVPGVILNLPYAAGVATCRSKTF